MASFYFLHKQKDFYKNFSKPGKYCILLYNYTGEVKILITSKKVYVSIFGIYIGRDKKSFKLKTLQNNNSSDSYSDLFIRGILFDKSKFIHEGIVKIPPKMVNIDASQKIQMITMSKNAQVESKPYLQIESNNVSCSHGLNIDKLPEDQLFYLKSRGMAKKEARKSLLLGFLNDINQKVELLGFKNEIKNLEMDLIDDFKI